MKPALPGSGNLDQQTGLVIMIYYTCAFPGSILNGYLEKGSTKPSCRLDSLFGSQLLDPY